MTRQPRRFRAAAVTLVALAMLVATAGAAAAAQPEPPPAPEVGPPRAHIIDPAVAELIPDGPALAGAEPLEALFVLADQPDFQVASTPETPEQFLASLVNVAERSQRELVAQIEARGDQVLNTFWIQNMVLARVRPATLLELTGVSNVARVIPNFEVTAPPVEEGGDQPSIQSPATWGLEKIGADRVQDELGATGEGTVVATLDTGVAADHPDLAGKMVTDDPNDFRFPGGWMEFSAQGLPVGSPPRDTQFHGTHVSGTIHGGDGSGSRIGVAPGARMMHALVLPGGSGTFTQVAAGMEWAIAPYDADGEPAGTPADVVNMSLGANEYIQETVQPTRNMYRAGVFPAFAVGNEVFGSCGVGSSAPGNVYEAVAIGATDPDDNVASFSCGNVVNKSDWPDPPADWPESWVTPDLSAPGVGVLSAEPSGSYRFLDGSSMATPHVAGAVALLLQLRPDLTVDQLRDTLQNTAFFDDRHGAERPNPRYGWGRIDVYEAALTATLDSGVTGVVSDAASGDPIAGATVEIAETGHTVTTGADGRYEVRLRPGTYHLSARQFGFEDAAGVAVEVVAGELAERNLALTPLPVGALSGTVSYQPTGHPVPGARITLFGAPGDWSAETDGDGRYRIEGIPVGQYRVQATSPGLVDSLVTEFAVEAGGTTAVDLTLGRPGAIERASVAHDGGEANLTSDQAAISGDGRWVGFRSLGNNLVDGVEVPFARSQLYVRDQRTGTNQIISISEDGAVADDLAAGVTLNHDGRYAAFYSYATTLVPEDTNGMADIFLRDLQEGTITRLSVASDGTEANASSFGPAMSDGGRLVVFASSATNLDGGNEINSDVFLHDRETGTTQLLSVTPDGGASEGYASQPDISGDGRYVTFTSDAGDLLEGVELDRVFRVYVRDLVTGRTELASASTDGEPSNGFAEYPKLSGDGRYVTFGSTSSNLVEGDTNGDFDSFVHDRETGATERVSVAGDGGQANGLSYRPVISDDGRVVAFRSSATNLVSGDNNNVTDVYAYDRETGRTRAVSLTEDDEFSVAPSMAPDISGDGRVVVFESQAPLVAGKTTPWPDVFARDLDPQAPEARFALWGLAVDPAEPSWPQDVTISVGVANIGDQEGDHELTLQVDGQADQTATVTLGSGETTTVRWTLARRVLGDYRVTVGPLGLTFTLAPPEVRWVAPPRTGSRLPVRITVVDDNRPVITVERVELSATDQDGRTFGPWEMDPRGRTYGVIVDDLPPGDYTLAVTLHQDGTSVVVAGPEVTRLGVPR